MLLLVSLITRPYFSEEKTLSFLFEGPTFIGTDVKTRNLIGPL